MIGHVGSAGLFQDPDSCPGCQRVHISDCVLDRNYRQGMSVINAVDMLVERVVFSNTNGTPPMAVSTLFFTIMCFKKYSLLLLNPPWI